MWSQVLSVMGALLVLTAFAANQMKRLTTDHVSYQVMNLIGGTVLCLAAIGVRQAGLILMEGAWAVISLIGLVRVLTRRPA
jgi:hypothetical protein